MITSSEIVCEYYQVILDKASKERDEIYWSRRAALMVLASERVQNIDDIEYTESYFSSLFQHNQLEYVLKLLREMNKAKEEYQELYYSIRDIVYRDKGNLI